MSEHELMRDCGCDRCEKYRDGEYKRFQSLDMDGAIEFVRFEKSQIEKEDDGQIGHVNADRLVDEILRYIMSHNPEYSVLCCEALELDKFRLWYA